MYMRMKLQTTQDEDGKKESKCVRPARLTSIHTCRDFMAQHNFQHSSRYINSALAEYTQVMLAYILFALCVCCYDTYNINFIAFSCLMRQTSAVCVPKASQPNAVYMLGCDFNNNANACSWSSIPLLVNGLFLSCFGSFWLRCDAHASINQSITNIHTI